MHDLTEPSKHHCDRNALSSDPRFPMSSSLLQIYSEGDVCDVLEPLRRTLRRWLPSELKELSKENVAVVNTYYLQLSAPATILSNTETLCLSNIESTYHSTSICYLF